jgi:uncharacterized protein YaiL (DUF2058 family)
MFRFAPLVIALLAASGAQAQVYKCIDSAGKVIYSQNPCPANTKSGTISRRLSAAPASSAAAPSAAESADKAGKGDATKAAAPKTPADQEQAFRKRAQDREKADKESEQKLAEAKRKEDNCRAARDQLATFEFGGRITQINAQGERVYLDDAQIEQQRAAARALVAQACN